ncbi:MAG: MBL fold metallo-hydrolase [Deltaproteobacteria bacterium]|nr:MBL fold metallo-hydrolase [Deltaproteobacteria bacterium]
MKRSGAFFLAAVLTLLYSASPARSSCRDMDVARNLLISPAHAAEADAIIEYFGHNFFQITTRKGTKVVTDPLAPGMHPSPYLTPHVVTVGREHPNHNYVELAQGNPLILRGLAYHGAEWNRVSINVRDVFIYNVPIYQRSFDTALKGAAFIFDLGTLCIAHLGDLSQTLTPEQLKQMGRVDVALIPIGGIFTMPPQTAREVLQQIKPKIAIPMHYRDNPYILAPFVQGLPTRRPENNTLIVSKSALPTATEIVVLRPYDGRDYR